MHTTPPKPAHVRWHIGIDAEGEQYAIYSLPGGYLSTRGEKIADQEEIHSASPPTLSTLSNTIFILQFPSSLLCPCIVVSTKEIFFLQLFIHYENRHDTSLLSFFFWVGSQKKKPPAVKKNGWAQDKRQFFCGVTLPSLSWKEYFYFFLNNWLAFARCTDVSSNHP